MSLTTYLLLALCQFIAVCLLVIFYCKCIKAEWESTDEPHYRTADGGVLSSDAREALAVANLYDKHNFN